MRDVATAADDGDGDAALALDVWAHRIRHYVGAYLAQLGGLDALVVPTNEELAIARAAAALAG